MKIYSWNIWFRNPDFDRVFDFIAASNADIFCLQEVPASFLERLRSLPYYLCETPEFDRQYPQGTHTTYLVILSRRPIHTSTQIPLRPVTHKTLRTKFFVWVMHSLGLWSPVGANRHAHFADIETPAGLVRVFNLHPALFPPQERVEEFLEAMAYYQAGQPTIICGDFNVLESPHITPFNWLLGGSVSDWIMTKRERLTLENHFLSYELTNAHRGSITHLISRSQLDHILVSKHFSIAEATVLRDSVGSDHRPIFVSLNT